MKYFSLFEVIAISKILKIESKSQPRQHNIVVYNGDSDIKDTQN